mgnify:CR=1 FL=1
MMYKVEEGYLLASLLKVKSKYFHEEIVGLSELRQFERELYQKSSELDIPIVCVSQYDLNDYFIYQGSNNCYAVKEGMQLSEVLGRFEGYLPLDVLKLLYSDDLILDMFVKVERKELKMQERELEKKKLLLKQLELRSIKQTEKVR